MNLELLEKLKKLTIIAMVSDDYLMEKLVLKGGNALDIFYGISPRASLDLDFSMPDDFKDDELEGIKTKIENSLHIPKKYISSKPFKVRTEIKQSERILLVGE
jgi:predicted nucleotidyltransferase component of viral defense system